MNQTKQQQIGDNITARIDEAGMLHLSVKIDEPLGPSSTGKSILLATTSGNRRIRLGEDRTVVVSVNAYEPVQAPAVDLEVEPAAASEASEAGEPKAAPAAQKAAPKGVASRKGA